MFFIIKNGFTLLELIIVTAVIAILSSFALPAYHRMMAAQEMHNTTTKITALSRQAKNLAAVQHTNVVICPSENLTSCQSAKWSSGFLIFSDKNKNRQIDTNETILHSEKLALQYSTLDWQGALRSPSLNFQASSGLPIGSNGTFYQCSLSSLQHKKIIMSKMGHIRVESLTQC